MSATCELLIWNRRGVARSTRPPKTPWVRPRRTARPETRSPAVASVKTRESSGRGERGLATRVDPASRHRGGHEQGIVQVRREQERVESRPPRIRRLDTGTGPGGSRWRWRPRSRAAGRAEQEEQGDPRAERNQQRAAEDHPDELRHRLGTDLTLSRTVPPSNHDGTGQCQAGEEREVGPDVRRPGPPRQDQPGVEGTGRGPDCCAHAEADPQQRRRVVPPPGPLGTSRTRSSRPRAAGSARAAAPASSILVTQHLDGVGVIVDHERTPRAEVEDPRARVYWAVTYWAIARSSPSTSWCSPIRSGPLAR